MSEVVSVDDKGRLVLPKKIRQQARIGRGTKLVARADGIGRVELTDLTVFATLAQGIGAKKLAGWKEDDHEATRYLLGSMKAENETR